MKANQTASSSEGFSLLEVMIALGIFAFVATGISQNLIMTRRMAESNVREVTSISAASGYMEQIKSMEYSKLLTSIRNPEVPLPTVLSEGEPDPVNIGQWIQKEITLDLGEDGESLRTMPFHIRVEVDDFVDSQEGEILGVTIFFAWEAAGTGQRVERGLRTMRSNVPTK